MPSEPSVETGLARSGWRAVQQDDVNAMVRQLRAEYEGGDPPDCTLLRLGRALLEQAREVARCAGLTDPSLERLHLAHRTGSSVTEVMSHSPVVWGLAEERAHEAESLLDQYLKRRPEDSAAWCYLAQCHLFPGRARQIAGVVARPCRRADDPSGALKAAANQALLDGDIRRFERRSREILRLVPRDRAALHGLAAAALAEGRHSECITRCESALKQAPDWGDLYLLLTRALCGLERHSQALQVLSEEALQRETLDGRQEVLLARARVYLELGEPDNASMDCITVLEDNEDDVEAWLLLAEAYEGEGRLDDALTCTDRAQKRALSDVTVAARAGVLSRLAAGRLKGAGGADLAQARVVIDHVESEARLRASRYHSNFQVHLVGHWVDGDEASGGRVELRQLGPIAAVTLRLGPVEFAILLELVKTLKKPSGRGWVQLVDRAEDRVPKWRRAYRGKGRRVLPQGVASVVYRIRKKAREAGLEDKELIESQPGGEYRLCADPKLVTTEGVRWNTSG